MVLSDRDIKKLIKNSVITFTPHLDLDTQLGSCSVDLRLGNYFKVFEHSKYPFIDPRNPTVISEITKEVEVNDGDYFMLHPNDFVLAVTKEYFTLPTDHLARLEGKSSMGRLGIVVHSTASVFEPGWKGVVVMELGNLGRMPVALYPGMRICALTFEKLTSSVDVPYAKKKGARFVDQRKP